MNQAEQFYPELYLADQNYGAGAYYLESLWSLRPLRQWLAGYSNRPLRILDVGCGKGVFLLDFVRGARERYQVQQVEVTGTDLVRSPGDLFAEISPDFKFVLHNVDGRPLPFADHSFDFISCNHVLEHIFETEKLVREFHRVLQPHGLCLISVPNLAAWMNRVIFLFAGQPIGSEVGTERITYGFWPRFLQKRLQRFRPAGHIRDFTPRGLRELSRHCGFETVGWWKQSPGPIARLSKWAGRNMGLLLKPIPTQ